MSQTTQHDANAYLMGGGGGPTWKFENEGVRKVGTITEPPTARQEREYDKDNPGGGAPKVFPSGDPIMGILVTVQTEERTPGDPEDDGKRTFYIEGKRLKDAVRTAIRATNAPGLEVGGKLDVTLTRYDVPGDRRSGRNWQVVYTPASSTALMGDQAPPAAGGGQAGDPWATQQQQPPVQQPQQAPAQQQAPMPAQQVTNENAAADKARQLINLGLDDQTIANATGLDADVIAVLRQATAA